MLRLLLWAAELAVATDPRSAALGVQQLRSLAVTGLADRTGTTLIKSALDSVTELSEMASTPSSAGPARLRDVPSSGTTGGQR